MQVTLEWTKANFGESEYRIYRDVDPIDPQNLPAPLSSVAAGVYEYVDTAVATDMTYYYCIAAVVGGVAYPSANFEVSTGVTGVATLFAGGERGLWVESIPPDVLAGDSTGSGVATVDGQVGRMVDKSSNGVAVTQSTSYDRPYLRQSGALYYAEPVPGDHFNVDDPLSYESMTVVIALQSSASGGRIFDNRGTGAGGTIPGLAVRTDVVFVDDGAGLNPSLSGLSLPSSPEVWTVIYDASTKTLSLRRNGVETDSVTEPALGSIVTTQNAKIMKSANSNDQYFDGDLYGVVVREGVLGQTAIDTAEQRMAEIAGVTL